ncbi:MAG: MXAN_5187 C-terminal domain-containing protein [Acidobacteriota bacterium]
MDVDQELTNLEDGIRRLKIEYEIFFNGGSPKLPYDLRWRVEALIKKYSDFGKMTFAQRFRYNTLVAKYHSYADLWRRMVKSKEEGRTQFGSVAVTPQAGNSADNEPMSPSGDRLICQLICSDLDEDSFKIQNLFKSLVEAKRECGEKPESMQFDSFKRFLSEKTVKLKEQFKCESVCYTVSIEAGRVKFSAKGKV